MCPYGRVLFFREHAFGISRYAGAGSPVSSVSDQVNLALPSPGHHYSVLKQDMPGSLIDMVGRRYWVGREFGRSAIT